MIRWRAFLRYGLLPCCLVAFAGAYIALDRHRKETEEHARFYNTGKTINTFLKSYCKALEKSFTDGDATAVGGLYTASAQRAGWTLDKDRDVAGVEVWNGRAGAWEEGRSAAARWSADYLAGLSAVEQTICKIDLIEDVDLERRARLTVKLILDGVDREGRTLQDRFFFRWWLLHENGDWKIERDTLVDGVRVAADGALFEDADPASLGVDFVHRRDGRLDKKAHRDTLKFGVAEHMSGGVSAVDVDQDGRPDLFLLGGEESRLYLNEDGPVFRDVTAQAGLGDVAQAHVALFADFDNDGDRDLFVGRYLAESRYYRNDTEDGGPLHGGPLRFVDATEGSGLGLVEPIASATLLDYDVDGDLDLYLAVNGQPFEAFPRLPFFARNAAPSRLLRNDGGGRFTDVTAASGTGTTGWSLAAAAADYDDDGLPDLAVANDFGRKVLYHNNGDGTFTDVAKEAGVLDFSGGMGLAFGDFDDDGHVDLYTSNINSNQRWFGEDRTIGLYLRNVALSRWALLDLKEYMALYNLVGEDWVNLGQQVGEGNSLFRNRGDGTFEELKDSHVNRAGWGWAVAFFDADNDTDLDIYAANGWISNTPGTDL